MRLRLEPEDAAVEAVGEEVVSLQAGRRRVRVNDRVVGRSETRIILRGELGAKT
jgi:hypothetical protein